MGREGYPEDCTSSTHLVDKQFGSSPDRTFSSYRCCKGRLWLSGSGAGVIHNLFVPFL